MFWICVTVFFAILMTYCIGFGLGTILLPVMCFYYPPMEALFLSAMLHGFQSAIKTVINFKYIPWRQVIWFSACAIPCSFFGSYCFIFLTQWRYNINFNIYSLSFCTTPLRIVIACSMLVFSILELLKPKHENTEKPIVFMSSGALSGFFGGLTGHQGVLRSMFTSKQFNSTYTLVAFNGVVSMCIDITRLLNYCKGTISVSTAPLYIIILLCIALLATFTGQNFLKHIKLNLINRLIFIFIILFAFFYGIGLV
jgi:uncharacterized membrane protein YfcA